MIKGQGDSTGIIDRGLEQTEIIKVTLLVMVKNELRGLQEIMPRIEPEWVDQIIIVDGKSTDGSADWARDNGYFVYVQERSGFRQAYEEVWPLIEGDVVITFSPDGNSIPELIPELISKINQGFDMVIVSRYLGSARSYDDSFLSRIGNWLFTHSINVLHGGRYSDAMGIYRAYDTRLVEYLALNNDRWYRTPAYLFRVKGVSWEPLLSVRAAKAKLSIGEIEGDEPPRIDGDSRVFPNIFVQIQWAAVYYFQIVRDVLFWQVPENRLTRGVSAKDRV